MIIRQLGACLRAGAIRSVSARRAAKGSDKIMKKTRASNKTSKPEVEMLPEYRFDYGKAQPNRFADRLKPGSRVVVLEPDVGAVFLTAEAVNAVLRALIQTMPKN